MAWLDSTFLLTVALLLYVGWTNRSGPWDGRLVLLLLLSPVLRYVSALFTFPIRLSLSAWAGPLLRWAGMNVRVAGNVLVSSGPDGTSVDMAVDPACMGLQLTGVSLLVGLFFVIWQEQQQRKTVSAAWLAAYGLVTFGLIVGCNLVRILMLVALSAMPGTGAHELIGLVCAVVYAWLPAWFLARGLVDWRGRPLPDHAATTVRRSTVRRSTVRRSTVRRSTVQRSTVRRPIIGRSAVWRLGGLVAGLGVMAFTALPRRVSVSPTRLAALTSQYGPGLRSRVLPGGFVQLNRPGLLIYVKPQTDWFSADHNPMTCWRGSGYALRYVRETTLDGHPAYTGELRKGGQTLHTAWWFSNGRLTTTSQLTMRMSLLRGEPNFVLINVTAVRRDALGQTANE